MNTTNLPPLPIAAVDEHNLQGGRLLYSRDQMQAYARAAILQERERNALVCAGIAAGHAGAARRLAGQHATHGAGMRDGANQCAATIWEGDK